MDSLSDVLVFMVTRVASSLPELLVHVAICCIIHSWLYIFMYPMWMTISIRDTAILSVVKHNSTKYENACSRQIIIKR